MSLKRKKIGVAFTGSFCTYRKAFQDLQKLIDEGAEVTTIFSDAAQSIDSRFGRADDFLEEAARKISDTYDCTGGTDWPGKPSGCIDYPAVYGEYHCKAGKWHYGFTSADGCKSTFEE